MITLALDGGLLWARWALRRLGYFSEGRPNSLIADLVEAPQTFYSGTLSRRLMAANLSELEERYQRSIGIAVGQRVMRGTFVVRWDGLDPCLASDNLCEWPRGYRIGLAYGLWFDPDGYLTLRPQSLLDALDVLGPVPDCSDDLAEWVRRIVAARPVDGLSEDWIESSQLEEIVRNRIRIRPSEEAAALRDLADNIVPPPPF